MHHRRWFCRDRDLGTDVYVACMVSGCVAAHRLQMNYLFNKLKLCAYNVSSLSSPNLPVLVPLKTTHPF